MTLWFLYSEGDDAPLHPVPAIAITEDADDLRLSDYTASLMGFNSVLVEMVDLNS
ncbi:hypothetical protein [Synechococcus elongatus]|uniref:hypothetical protein n=1 Tax=Synechococcus elongatus TaxID=32046 RepID=UPI001374E5FD|nr:hypothetical protein [Synechococcus elongatus]